MERYVAFLRGMNLGKRRIKNPELVAHFKKLGMDSLAVTDHGTPARVTAAEPMGREVLYTADSELGVVRFLEAGAEPRHREGDNLQLDLSRSNALLFDKATGRRIDTRIALQAP